LGGLVLQAQGTPWEITLGGGSQFARPRSNEWPDAVGGQLRGQSVTLDKDYTTVTLGVGLRLAVLGPWRVWGRLEAAQATSEPKSEFRWVEFTGIQEQSALISGGTRLQCVTPAVDFAYSAGDWGEWGIGLGAQAARVTFTPSRADTDDNGTTVAVPARAQATVTDPVLRLSASFVKSYREVSLLARVLYTRNLASRDSIDSLAYSDMTSLNTKVLKLTVPVGETRVEFGVRF
jgi:hypothetical protein